MPLPYLTAILTVLLLPTVVMSQDVGDPCTSDQECETLLCVEGVCDTDENPCTMYVVCEDESPDCAYESSVLDGTPCAGGVCVAGTCVPDVELPNMDGGMPDPGSDSDDVYGEPRYEGGGICSNSVAMLPANSPIAGSFLFLMLLGCIRAARKTR